MVNQLAESLAVLLGLDPYTWVLWLAIFIKIALVVGVYFAVVSLIPIFCIWWERKVAGHIQARLGPKNVGPFGLLQSFADGGKLLLKEDLTPRVADSFLFKFAPYITFAPVFAAFLALPFGPQFIFESSLNIGVLFLLAVLSVEVMGVILAGWGSGSKWAVYGAMREACQMVSYEVPLGIAIICGVLTAGTLNMLELSFLQGAGLWDWFIFHNPFIFTAFILYFIASLASNKRAPFDLPESESELVAGFHTEYSGLRFSFFFFAEYAAMFVVGGIQAALFLGGWNSPLGGHDPIYLLLGYDPVAAGQAYMNGLIGANHGLDATAHAMGLSHIGLWLLNFYCAAWFIFKAMVIIFIQMWIRWSLPRIRIDQVLYICVKVLLPISLITLAGNAVWIALVRQPVNPLTDNPALIHWGHLLADEPLLQYITQVALMIVGLTCVAGCGAIILHALLTRRKHPPKSFFTDVMPVGDKIAFTTSGDAGRSGENG